MILIPNIAGEIVLQFQRGDEPNSREEICYGDGGLQMKLVLRKGLRSSEAVSGGLFLHGITTTCCSFIYSKTLYDYV